MSNNLYSHSDLSEFYLGVYFGFHDSSISVATDRGVVLHLEAERVLQRKHARASHDEMLSLIDTALLHLGASIANCKGVALSVSGSQFPLDDVQLGGARFQPTLVGHHEGHIAVLPISRSQSTVVVSADGGSEDGFGAIYLTQPGRAPIRLQRLDDALSNGRTYGAIARLLVEKDYMNANLDGGGKLLGLASYGCPDPSVEAGIFDSVALLNSGPLGHDEVAARFGLPTEPRADPHLDAACRTLAATFQKCWTEDACRKIESWRYLSPNLAITGGCAQNVSSNAALARREYSSTTVPFSPTDGGQSIGAVVAAFDIPPPTNPYLGRDFGVRVSPAVVVRLVADLQARKIVGLYQGSAESGPRALGNRSILALASNPESRDAVSSVVKRREPYRPLAPVVRASDMKRFCQSAPGTDSSYMSYAWPVTEEFARLAPAAVHVDGTSRVQSLTRSMNPSLMMVLDTLEIHGDSPALINTSMNVAGKPMVDTPGDAVAFFEESGIDVLYIGDRRIAR